MLTTPSAVTPIQRCIPTGPLYNKRSTSELVDQIQKQLPSERVQHRFNMAEKEKELVLALLSWPRSLELARRDREGLRPRTEPQHNDPFH
jgi:hypothetical protein